MWIVHSTRENLFISEESGFLVERNHVQQIFILTFTGNHFGKMPFRNDQFPYIDDLLLDKIRVII